MNDNRKKKKEIIRERKWASIAGKRKTHIRKKKMKGHRMKKEHGRMNERRKKEWITEER